MCMCMCQCLFAFAFVCVRARGCACVREYLCEYVCLAMKLFELTLSSGNGERQGKEESRGERGRKAKDCSCFLLPEK